MEFTKVKNYRTVRDHCDLAENVKVILCNLRFNVPKEVPGFDRLPFYNKRISKQVCERIWIPWGNTEKYKTFSNLIEKEVTKIDKDGNARVANISYKIKFIGSAKCLTSSLSILAKYESVKDNLRKYKCTSCNKYSSNNLDEEFEKRFKNRFRFSNNDVNKFILLFRKGIILLAEKGEFYHNLNMEDITDAD